MAGPPPQAPADPPHAGTPGPGREPRRRALFTGWGLFWAAVLVLLLAGLAFAAFVGYLWASDHGFSAHVTGKRCQGPLMRDNANRVDLRTDFLAIDRSVWGVSDTACAVIQPGHYVVHHIRSRHTTVYESHGGDCLYDSQRGTNC